MLLLLVPHIHLQLAALTLHPSKQHLAHQRGLPLTQQAPTHSRRQCQPVLLRLLLVMWLLLVEQALPLCSRAVRHLC